MTLVFLFVGAAGAALLAALSDGPTGVLVVLGACIGALFAQTRDLRTRLASLEANQRAAAAKRSTPFIDPERVAVDATAAAPEPARAAAATHASVPPVAVSATAFAPASSQPPQDTPAARAPVAQFAPAPAARTTTPADPVEVAFGGVRRWFTQGNVPVKVGVIVLFLGVAALLKYAAGQGWLRMPIEFRLAGIAVGSLAALAFAWKKRTSHRSFALSLQGGAIGILVLDVFVAFRLYGLLPAGLAFALLVVIVAGGAMLAVLQDAMALAVLAIAGGFLAPILVSTGSGDHVVLFAYYALLNAAVFGIAWIRPWRALNLLGFAFTFGIATAWGVLRYRADQFASTEPFLVLFFLFYVSLPVLYALRRRSAQTAEGRDIVDGTLVFGTPLVAFALQVGLLQPARLPLAFSAVGIAALYAGLATIALRRWKLTLLGQSHAVLALGFATLAVPLALSARSTSCTWALEGAALVWLGLRQQRRLPRWIGYGLQAAAAVAFFAAFGRETESRAVFNGTFANASLMALAALFTARLLVQVGPAPAARGVARGFFVWGWTWLWLACGNEIALFAPAAQFANLALVLVCATALVAGEALRRWYWDDCVWPVFAMFPLALVVFAFMTDAGTDLVDRGLLEHGSAAAWAFFVVCALRSLEALRTRDAAPFVQAVFLWLLVLVVGSEVVHLLGRHLGLDVVWQAFGGLVVAALMFALVLQRNALVRWPLAGAAEPLRRALLASFAGVLGVGCLAGLFAAGDPAPLPYVPLLNPLELGQVAVLVLLLRWFGQAVREGRSLVDAEWRARALAVAGFALLTSVTLRGAHFLGGVAWGDALWDSPLAQAALSITWTLAGIAAMLLGQRRGSRAVWFGGALLMAVVVAKLALLDRRFMHDLQAIVGVLVVGLLLVVVGYFAPVPPRPGSKAVDA